MAINAIGLKLSMVKTFAQCVKIIINQKFSPTKSWKQKGDLLCLPLRATWLSPMLSHLMDVSIHTFVKRTVQIS